MPVVSSRATSRIPPGSPPIVIGLVNNMPDAALQRTERQFLDLVLAVSQNVPVQWRRFYIPEVPRGEVGRLYLAQSYEDIGALWTGRLHGLIVTGNEPRTPVLIDEPYWPTLAKLVDWAEENTISTIWSCLAAHAAVLHIDGIPRRALNEKLSGVFDCRKAESHSIFARAPSRWRVPHSRYNELPEEALVSKGYSILSRSPEAGADIFAKQRQSLFIFLQGHPEYDAAALLREYRRDSARFIAGERDSYPQMPRGYFDEETRAALAAYQEQVLCAPHLDPAPRFPTVAKERLGHGWRGLAMRLYANWLSYLVEHGSQNPCSLSSAAFSGQIQSQSVLTTPSSEIRPP
jgi:homoserine O-succinyltransferase/O-acetyltransferase